MNILRTAILVLTALVLPARGETVDATFTSVSTIPVTAVSYTATGNDVNITLSFKPPTGTSLTVVNNTGLPFITGQFSNLAQGQRVNLAYNGFIYPFVANYYGGTGNDLVLVWAYQSPVAWGHNSDGQLGNDGATDSSTPVEVTAAGVLAGKTVIAAAAGASHSLALCGDGTVAAWGSNSYGQLGNGDSISSTTPVAVTASGVLAGRTVVAVAAGQYHSLVVCSDGTLAAWGYNNYGQLGNGSTTNSSTPVTVTTTGFLAGKTVVAVTAGQYHSLALCADGTVAAWGFNLYGQLGNGTSTSKSTPVAVTVTGVLAGKTVVSVAAGGSLSLVRCADSMVAAWGYNGNGALGNGSTTNSNTPVAAIATGVLAGRTVIAVSSGNSHSLALCADGTVAAWGHNSSGQLGNGTSTSSSAPVAVTTTGLLAGKTVIAAAAGVGHTLALCADGTVAAWGGQLGNGSTASSNTPVAVTATGVLDGRTVVAVTAGNSHSLALAASPLSANVGLASVEVSNGTSVLVYSSGDIYSACVPMDTSSITVVPTVSDPNAVVEVNGATVASGTASPTITVLPGINSVALVVRAEDRTVIKTYTLSVLRPEPLNVTFNSPDAPALTFPAYDATGLTVQFALNFKPETGCQLSLVKNTGPAFINGRFNNLAQGQIVRISYSGVGYPFIANYYGGTGNDLVLVWAYQSLASWGANAYGQLGNGGTISSSTPVAVPATGVLAGKVVVAVAAGGSHSLALCLDGTVAAWGSNSTAQLGNGTTTSSSTPVGVPATGVLAGKAVIAVAAGQSHSLALCSDGTVAAWGSNGGGQLGNGGTTSTSPVEVSSTGALTGKTVVAVAAGQYHSLALCADGTVAAWGSNTYGQLGNSTTSSSSPVEVTSNGVLAGKTVVAIAAGDLFSLALCLDGTVAAWGYNNYGQLGNGGIADSTKPVAVTASGVLAGKTVVAVAAGDLHSHALCSDGTVAAWGHNGYGQLGNGGTTSSTTPIAVPASGVLAGKTVVRVAAGAIHSLALCSDGTVAAWGDSSSGQLGNGSTISSRLPVTVLSAGGLAGRTAFFIAAGGSHNLAIATIPLSDNSDLTALTLANTPLSPLFRPGVQLFSALVPTNTPSITVTATAAHPFSSVTANGAAVPSGTASQSIPLSFGVNTITVTVLSESHEASATYTLSVLRPPPLTAASFLPGAAAPVRFPAYDATGNTVSLSLGYPPLPGSTLTVIDNTGLGFITGRFSNLAHGQTVTLWYLGEEYGFIADYFGGTGNDLVLRWADVDLAAWGGNASGQLGDGGTLDVTRPTAVPASGALASRAVFAVATGDYHSVVRCADGTAAAWGYNLFGQLGNNSISDSPMPVAVAVANHGTLAGKTVAAVAAGAIHSLALCSDGTVAAWGGNYSGQLGNNSTTSCRAPVAVSTNGVLAEKTVVAIAAGESHSLALCSDGTVAAWGDNYSGQLGNGTVDGRRVPVAVDVSGVLAGKFVVAIAAGGYHSLALCSDGTVAGWGYNGYGQLGVGSLVDSAVPVALDLSGVLGGKVVSAIAAGENHSLLLCTDGSIASCGSNTNGQLGDGTNTDRSVPIRISTAGVLSGRAVNAVSAGKRHSMGLCADGTLATWGANESGQLGNNSTLASNVPVPAWTSGLGSGVRFTTLPSGPFGSHVLALASAPSAVADSYTQWLAGVLPESAMNNPAITSELAMPANDGITNLMKYALSLAPLADGSVGLPRAGSQGGYLTLTYRKNKQAPDLTYTVQAGDSVGEESWAPATSVVERTDAGDHWMVTVRDNVPIVGHPRRFMRLRVGR